MSSKKKFIIALCSVAVVAVGALVALVAVLASFTATANSGNINISYTAINVKATISASYGYTDATGTVIKCGDADVMVFTGEESDATTSQNFAGVTYNFTRENNDIYLKYEITNDDTAANCSLALNPNLSAENVTVTYKVTGAVEADMEDYGAFPSSVSIAKKEGETASTCTVMVRIHMDNATKDVTLSGSLQFILQV